MSGNGLFQIILYFAVLLALIKPLGRYMALVYENQPCGLDRVLGIFERTIYWLCGIKREQEMNWKQYAAAMLLFNLVGLLAVYWLQRLQTSLPLNPQNFPAVSHSTAFNTAISFVTNTNWQSYSGETTMSYFTQMCAFTVQNFLSAATGMSVLMALIRGIVRRQTTLLGNFWVDTIRGTLYILLPLSTLFALIFVSQGMIQNFHAYQEASLLQSVNYQQTVKDDKGNPQTKIMTVNEQILPMGPVASQEAIKQLGTNGGGFFNTNSAHPFENPTPLTNFLEMLALLLIPAALCYTFGIMVRDSRQGRVILLTMLIIFVPLVFLTTTAEQNGSPALAQMGIDFSHHGNYAGGNMEGKETRFGVVNSALWATATTAASNGSVNAMLDSFTPLGGLIPLWLINLSEVIFGGVGSGLYGMLLFVILTVFIAGLMVGRTPEYLGKKIEPYEMKMASFAVLLMPKTVLICTALAAVTLWGTSSLGNPGAHGFTEMLYAFSSMTNNNGSAFAGLNANTPFYNILGGLAMLVGRFWVAIPVLAIAGSLAKKKTVANNEDMLPTHTPFFIGLLASTVVILGTLMFLPAFALGPIVEQLQMVAH